MVDNPNSAAISVVSTMTLVMAKFLEVLHEEVPNAKFVYDEKLSYPTALAAFRAKNNLTDTYTNFYPMFAFRRTVLRYAKDGIAQRQVSARVKRLASEHGTGRSEIYRPLLGEFDLEFMYITKNMEELEEFEVAYLSEESISGEKKIDVFPQKAIDGPLPAVVQGPFPYYLKYDSLSDKNIETDEVYFKAVGGKITIRGHYLVFRTLAKHILEINFFLKELNGNVLGQEQIT